MRVICFGSLNIDYVYTVEHFVRPGETMHCRNRQVFAGGKGLNQAIALGKAGVVVGMAGKIGTDGEFLKEKLQAAGVDTTFLLTDPVLPTGHAVINVDAAGQNTIVLFGGSNQAVTPEEMEAVLARTAPGDALVMQNEISNLPFLFRRAKAAGLTLFFNFAPFAAADARYLPLELVDYLILNETEGEGLAGSADPEEILTLLRRRYPATTVILTLGADGALARSGDEVIRVPSPPAVVADTTSAGDTFIGYLVAGLGRGLAVREAMALGCAAAAITVSRPGAADSIPYFHEVDC